MIKLTNKSLVDIESLYKHLKIINEFNNLKYMTYYDLKNLIRVQIKGEQHVKDDC